MASGQLRPLPRLVTTGAHIGGEEDRTDSPFRLSLYTTSWAHDVTGDNVYHPGV